LKPSALGSSGEPSVELEVFLPGTEYLASWTGMVPRVYADDGKVPSAMTLL